MESPAASFWTYAAADPQAVAVIDPDGTRTTYGELAARAHRVSHAVLRTGAQVGDRVALLAHNGVGFLEWALGTAQVGLRLVPVNHHLTAAEAGYVVSDAQVSLAVVDARLADLGRAALDVAAIPFDQRVALDRAVGFRDVENLLAGCPETAPDVRVQGQVMLYTSGTTGRPKGVLWPISGASPEEAQQALEPLMFRRGMRHDPGAVSFVTGPLYHGAPGAWALQALHHGHTVLLMGRWDSETFLQLVERHRVRTAQMAPIHFHRLLALEESRRKGFDLSSLCVVSHAGAACPVDVKHRMMAWFGPVLYEYYASSEGFGTSIGPEEWLAHPGSVGHAERDGTEMRVRDDEGRDLPVGEAGTLWVRNPGGVRSAYFNDAGKTARSHSADGFYSVGDVGYLDEDGYLFLVDRRVDLILSGGVNVYPAEVEQALADHPDVADVAVVGVPDVEWGQAVHAVVVPRPGADAEQLPSALQAWARQRIAGFKVPRSVELRDELPYTEAGKLLRRVLRDAYWPAR
jgi:long-chain acyl-CoA synthetase